MLGKSDCPCTKTKVENTFFSNLQVGEVPVSIGFNHFLQFSKKKLKSAFVLLIVLFFDGLEGEADSNTPRGTRQQQRQNRHVGGVTVRSFWAFYININIGNIAHGVK